MTIRFVSLSSWTAGVSMLEQLSLGAGDEHRSHLENRLSATSESTTRFLNRTRSNADVPQLGTVLGAVYAYVVCAHHTCFACLTGYSDI